MKRVAKAFLAALVVTAAVALSFAVSLILEWDVLVAMLLLSFLCVFLAYA